MITYDRLLYKTSDSNSFKELRYVEKYAFNFDFELSFDTYNDFIAASLCDEWKNYKGVNANTRLPSRMCALIFKENEINASNTGLTSNSLDFTKLGLVPGLWLKIGGENEKSRFVNSSNNDFVRIKNIDPNNSTFDYLPEGWSAEKGRSISIELWIGEYVRNGNVEKYFDFKLEDREQNSTIVFKSKIQKFSLLANASENFITGNIQTGIDGNLSYEQFPLTDNYIPVNKFPVMNVTGMEYKIFCEGKILTKENSFVMAIDFEFGFDEYGIFSQKIKYNLYDILNDRMEIFKRWKIYSHTLIFKDNQNNSYIFDIPYTTVSLIEAVEVDQITFDVEFIVFTDPALGYRAHVQRIPC